MKFSHHRFIIAIKCYLNFVDIHILHPSGKKHYIKPREGTKHNLMSAYNGLNKSCLVNKGKMAKMQPLSFSPFSVVS